MASNILPVPQTRCRLLDENDFPVTDWYPVATVNISREQTELSPVRNELKIRLKKCDSLLLNQTMYNGISRNLKLEVVCGEDVYIFTRAIAKSFEVIQFPQWPEGPEDKSELYFDSSWLFKDEFKNGEPVTDNITRIFEHSYGNTRFHDEYYATYRIGVDRAYESVNEGPLSDLQELTVRVIKNKPREVFSWLEEGF